MAENYEKKVVESSGPMVSVLIPTFNRPRYLSEALASVLRQSYGNLQIIVINDGGEDVSGIVNSFSGPRIIFINRKENRGKAFSLNEALICAEGKYIAYLDDDDLYYPNHIATLVNALENKTDCKVAYSDLYKAYCQVTPDAGRKVLSKVVELSRDFDRFFVLYFNLAVHSCLMHRRDLLEKTGLYNEELNVLIDWDMTRRLAFFSDFHHIYEITGEHCSSVAESDRISIQRRKDKTEYSRNIMTIRTTRPAKPWPKIKDMSIIFTTERLNRQAGRTLGSIWRHTFYPYEIYLPLPQADFNKINTDMPNVLPVPVNPLSSQSERIDTALARCDGEFIAIVPSGFAVKEMWVEGPLYALINPAPVEHRLTPNRCGVSHEGFELEGSTDTLWAAVVRKSDLQYARRNFPNLSVQESLKAAGVVLRRPSFEEFPFQLDNLLQQARLAEKDGKWAQAARMFEYIAEHYQNELWMNTLAAKAFFKAGGYARAAKLSCELNQQRPTVDTLLLEAKLNRQEENFNSAIELLKRAEQILEDPNLQ